ncbi:MAG: DUF3429 domain-containing protein [Pseudomonadota bacterium]
MQNPSYKSRQQELTELGLAGLAPFWVAAIGVWVVPVLTNSTSFALTLHSMALAYGAIIASYMAGMGAGGLVAGARQSGEPLLPGMVATLVAWLAAWTNLPFTLSLAASWRHALILMVLGYLLLRDLRAVATGVAPTWYGPLRMRLTFWASLAIILIISRLMLWGYY